MALICLHYQLPIALSSGTQVESYLRQGEIGQQNQTNRDNIAQHGTSEHEMNETFAHWHMDKWTMLYHSNFQRSNLVIRLFSQH